MAFSCAFWGIADLLLLLLVRRLRFALLARTKASFKQQLCSSILSAPYQMFENKDCLSLLNNDTQTICDCFFAALLSIYQVIWSFVLSLASVSLLNPAITTTLLGIGLVSVLAPHWLGRRLDQMQTACSTLKEEYSLLVQDLTGGLITLKTCRAEKAFAARHQRINQKLEVQQCAVNNRLYLSTWISMLCSTAAYLLTLLVGGWFVLQGRMTTGWRCHQHFPADRRRCRSAGTGAGAVVADPLDPIAPPQMQRDFKNRLRPSPTLLRWGEPNLLGSSFPLPQQQQRHPVV